MTRHVQCVDGQTRVRWAPQILSVQGFHRLTVLEESRVEARLSRLI